MPAKPQVHTIFVACPQDTEPERDTIARLCAEYSEQEGIERGAYFRVVDGRSAPGGIGRPQSRINPKLDDADFFVLVLHERWGTPSGDESGNGSSSGSHEEYLRAKRNLQDPSRPMCDLLVLFKAPLPGKLTDPGRQLSQVLDFKAEIEGEKEIFLQEFESEAEFHRIVQNQLSQWLRNIENGIVAPRRCLQPAVREALSGGSYAYTFYIREDRSRLSDVLRLAAARGAEWAFASLDALESSQVSRIEPMITRAIADDDSPLAHVAYSALLHQIGRYDGSLKVARRVSSLAYDSGLESEVRLTILQQLAFLETSLGRPEAAIEARRLAIRLVEDVDDSKRQAEETGSLGVLYQLCRRWAEAVGCHRAAIELHASAGSLSGQASERGRLGSALWALGEHQAAEEQHRLALALYRDAGDSLGQANQSLRLGVTLEAVANAAEDPKTKERFLAESITCYGSALERFQLCESLDGVSAACGNLATSYLKAGDLEQAESHMERAIGLDIQSGNRLLEAVHLDCMADILLACAGDGRQGTSGLLDRAERSRRQALDVFLGHGNTRREALLLDGLANIAQLRGDLEQAESLQRQSVDIAMAHALQREVVGFLYYNLACVLSIRGDMDGCLAALFAARRADPGVTANYRCDEDLAPFLASDRHSDFAG